MKVRFSYYLVFGGLTAGLLLAGFGCSQAINDGVDGALSPVSTSLDALRDAKTFSAEEQARLNREAESIANEMTVAMILTENAFVPSGAEVGEAVGCNDKAAFTKAARAAATDDVVHDALTSLFAVKDSTYNSLYNSLYQSSLQVDRIISPDGVTTEVWLKGQVASGGACDDPRIKAQIEQTVRRLRPTYKIYLNGSEAEYRCLGDQSGLCE